MKYSKMGMGVGDEVASKGGFLSGRGAGLLRLLSLAVGLWHQGWVCHMGLLPWALFSCDPPQGVRGL